MRCESLCYAPSAWAIKERPTFTYLVQVARRAEVPIALSTHVVALHMLPVSDAVVVPVRASTIVATFTYDSTTFVAAMIEQVVPTRTIEVAFWAFVMVT